MNEWMIDEEVNENGRFSDIFLHHNFLMKAKFPETILENCTTRGNRVTSRDQFSFALNTRSLQACFLHLPIKWLPEVSCTNPNVSQLLALPDLDVRSVTSDVKVYATDIWSLFIMQIIEKSFLLFFFFSTPFSFFYSNCGSRYMQMLMYLNWSVVTFAAIRKKKMHWISVISR